MPETLTQHQDNTFLPPAEPYTFATDDPGVTDHYTPNSIDTPFGQSGNTLPLHDQSLEDEAIRELFETMMKSLGATSLSGVIEHPVEAIPMPHPSTQARLAKESAAQPAYDHQGSTAALRARLDALFNQPAYGSPTTQEQPRHTPTPKKASPFAVSFSNRPTSLVPPPKSHSQPIPEAIFSSPHTSHESPPPRPYTPTFDLKFLDSTFSSETITKAQQALQEAAIKSNATPGDAESRVRTAREALKALHPDHNPGQTEAQQDVAKAVSVVLGVESNKPEAKAARAARIQQKQANVAPPQPAQQEAVPVQNVASEPVTGPHPQAVSDAAPSAAPPSTVGSSTAPPAPNVQAAPT